MKRRWWRYISCAISYQTSDSIPHLLSVANTCPELLTLLRFSFLMDKGKRLSGGLAVAHMDATGKPRVNFGCEPHGSTVRATELDRLREAGDFHQSVNRRAGISRDNAKVTEKEKAIMSLLPL